MYRALLVPEIRRLLSVILKKVTWLDETFFIDESRVLGNGKRSFFLDPGRLSHSFLLVRTLELEGNGDMA